jgi:hypothetical protein
MQSKIQKSRNVTLFYTDDALKVSIWPSGFRGEDLKRSANQKQELPMAAMFVNGSGKKRLLI